MDCEKQPFIDLHIHSTASDGSLTPVEIMRAAESEGLSAISITDHDTIDGCRQIRESPLAFSLDFLTGVEISASGPEKTSAILSGSLHILGYDIDIDHQRLNRNLADLERSRNQRTPGIIRRLNDLGVPISAEEVKRFSGGRQIGRPHIARAMLQRGVVSSIDEAFDRFIGPGGPAYIDKERLPCDQAIELILQARGVPVLAHPGLISTNGENQLESLVALLKDMGLKGIEVYYPGHSGKQIIQYTALADRYDLLITGGSDFHGAINPHIIMGKGTGDLFVDIVLYQRLLAWNRKNARPTEPS